ncbi:MAG: outer membrane protein assembly factor BamC [Gammaproteobacteria bacterium]|nr:outer membrane protein assembly factor BamC [Gammaproteobacteria bacterium]
MPAPEGARFGGGCTAWNERGGSRRRRARGPGRPIERALSRAAGFGAVAFSALLLTGCGWFSDDKGFFVNPTDDYIDARQGRGLVIPEDLDQTIEDPFPIPAIPEQQNARFYPGRPPLPGTIYSSDNRDEIRIQRLGQRIWLVVPEPPTTVWPKIKQFLADNGVAVDSEAPANGRITTEWLAIADEPYRDVVRSVLREARAEEPGRRFSGRERLLLRVEQGIRELTSEVHIRHQSDRGAIVNPDAIVDLEPVLSDLAGVERDFLNELGAYIAARVAEQTVSMVALEIAGQEKAEIGRDQAGEPVLRLFLDPERAWATLDQALDAAAVDVIELDRVAGTCLIHIPETAFTGPVTEERRGFFRRLNPFRGTRSEEAADILLRVRQEEERRHAITAHGVGGDAVSDDYRQQVLILIREYAG